ncbi:MAG: secretin N-terminal domain-containing protein [Opitutaceae bacterium]|nr:secretin N-terminal domain-containing protein [Opitutaceae bacterium]
MSYHPFPRVFTALLTALLLTAEPLAGQTSDPDAGSPPAAQPPAAAPLPARSPAIAPLTDETIGPVQMRGETLEAVLFQLARLTGRSIIRPQALPATEGYTISLPPMLKSEVILALETMLDLSGIAVSPLGEKFLKVVPLGQVRTEAPEMIEGSTLGLAPSGRVAAKLFRLEFLRVGELKDQVTPLLNPNLGGPVMFEKTNAVLVTDSVSTLQRIEQLIEQLDKPAISGLQPKFYSLHFAKASDLVNKISAILKPPLSNQVSSATSISADDRTNQIVLISDPRQYPFFDELIAKLDVKADPNTRNEVIYLKHAAAKDVATLLTNVVSGRNQAADRVGQTAARPGLGVVPGALPVAPTPATPGPLPATPTLLAEAGASSEFSSLITVLPDERSNSIIVSGTVDDIRLIREIVEKVDVLLAQVRIEVVIAEVVLGDAASTGIGTLGLQVEGNKLTGIKGTASGLAVGGTADSSGFATPVGDLSLVGIVSLSTTPRKDNSRILSVPAITTTHNKEAELFFGETRPVISGSTSMPTSVSASGLTTSSTVAQQEIGTTVKVKPLIGNDGSVQLDIKQEISDVTGTVILDGNTQYIIGKRKTDSFITVKSGEIIVLAGMQKENYTHNTSRLGPIPFIGDLLGTRSRNRTRSELVVFIRPTVLTNTPADNEPALKQIDAMPDSGEIRQKLDPNYVPPKTPFYKKHIQIP